MTFISFTENQRFHPSRYVSIFIGRYHPVSTVVILCRAMMRFLRLHVIITIIINTSMVCKLCKNEEHFVNLATNNNSNCRGLIYTHIWWITVKDGYLCRKCNRQIHTLHNHTLTFRLLCQKYNGPSQDTQKVIKSKSIILQLCQNS